MGNAFGVSSFALNQARESQCAVIFGWVMDLIEGFLAWGEVLQMANCWAIRGVFEGSVLDCEWVTGKCLASCLAHFNLNKKY